MSRGLRVAALSVVAALSLLGLVGCRDGGPVARPASPTSAASSADPLAGIESDLDAVERDLHADGDRLPNR